MISGAVTVQQIVIYEGPGTQPFSPQERLQLMRSLLQRGYSASLRRDSASLRDKTGYRLILLGRFRGQVPPNISEECRDADRNEVLLVRDVTDRNHDEVLQLVEELCDQPAHSVVHQWKPWFPVIDYGRCTNCMQCLSFCLFDVYGVTPAGQITVQNEDNCKTDCPACSRVCPEVAILFPKYKAGPINGDEVSEDDVRREAMRVDISALLGGDIYSMLRDRSVKAKSRFTKERDDERALKERQRCLKKLQEDAGLEVPPEVLASLPSMDEIQRKAAEAKQRARFAREENQIRE